MLTSSANTLPPDSVARVAERMAAFGGTWFLAGDYAADCWRGRRQRHFAVVIGVFEDDQRSLLDVFHGWELVGLDRNDPLAERRWTGRRLEAGRMWRTRPKVYASSPDGLEVEVVLYQREGDDWVLRVRPDPFAPDTSSLPVIVPLESAIADAGWGIPTVQPDVLLFLDAFGPRARDLTNLRALLPMLSDEQRQWLYRAIEGVRPDYPWARVIAHYDGHVTDPDDDFTGELRIGESLVRSLLASQFPEWANLPLRPVASVGTVNTIFRLGHDMVVRLPRRQRFHDPEDLGDKLEALAPLLPVAIPQVLALGEPGDGYPYKWSVSTWLDGDMWDLERLDDPCAAAVQFAEFTRAVHAIDPSTVGLATGETPRPPASSPSRLAERYDTRRTYAAATDWIDTRAFVKVWTAGQRIPPWQGRPVLLHADLSPDNVLIRDGRLHAVIDWASLTVGDPAADAMAAWGMFSGQSRQAFRDAMGLDDATWARAHTMIVHGAMTTYHYYVHTHPAIAANAKQALIDVLADTPGQYTPMK